MMDARIIQENDTVCSWEWIHAIKETANEVSERDGIE